MRPILHHPTARLWCLVGLTGMALSTIVFLGEGQTRTLTTPPPIRSVKAQDPHTTGMVSKPDPSEKNRVAQSTNLTHHLEEVAREMATEEKPNKKQFGLAILFLGMLAEKS